MMKIKLFQIDLDRDEQGEAFVDLENRERIGLDGDVDPSIYDLVFDGEVACRSAEEVFELFNTKAPPEYSGRSMSVSDVLQIESGGRALPGFYFCRSIGFREIEFDPNRTVNRLAAAIRVVVIEPKKQARISHINHSLNDLQHCVGGDIEATYPYDDRVAIVCNEEGKLNGLDLNRAIRNNDNDIVDIMAGTFFICGCGETDFSSLSETLARKYQKKFQHPERFMLFEDSIVAMPMMPANDNLER